MRAVLRFWLSLLAIPGMLALAQVFGLFTLTDGRIFDLVTVNGNSGTPQVVIVELDEAFHQRGPDRFARLERTLRQLGVVRAGYLDGVSQVERTTPGVPPLPRVVAWTPLRQVDGSGWQPRGTGDGETRDLPGTAYGARVLAPAQYGIYRRQLGALGGSDQPLGTFEAKLANVTVTPGPFYIRMARHQSIPRVSANQLDTRLFDAETLSGKVALITVPQSDQRLLPTPLTPDVRATSEAVLRAYAVNSLRNGDIVKAMRHWAMLLLLLGAAAVLALIFSRIDPKRFALSVPLGASVLAAAANWASLAWLDILLPVTALMILPWLIAYDRLLWRETRQDLRLEQVAARAVHQSFRRSALREAANLTDYFGSAANVAGLEKYLALELLEDGSVQEVCAAQAGIADLALSGKALKKELQASQDRSQPVEASTLVPTWPGAPRLAWLGGAESQYFLLFQTPPEGLSGKHARLVRAFVMSFREIYQWRRNLNARSQMDERVRPIDERVARAVSLVSTEAQQIRHGFDMTQSAVGIYHLIGSPLHANAQMRSIQREAGLAGDESSLARTLATLTELDERQITALFSELVLNGGQMLLPMKQIGNVDRILRIAVPERLAREDHRVFVLEAIDTTELHRAADLRQAVALFIDLQLRNDLEAILLGARLAGDDRLDTPRLRTVVANVGKTARRAKQRLDEVAQLVQGTNEQLVEASYPVNAGQIVSKAHERVADLAKDLMVEIDLTTPGISGFTIAEPRTLADMLEAMMRVVIADTPRGDSISVILEEFERETVIRVSGGFGIGFGRLMSLMDTSENEAVGEYRQIADAIPKARKWGATVSYWGREADGFGFTINMKRIG